MNIQNHHHQKKTGSIRGREERMKMKPLVACRWECRISGRPPSSIKLL